MVHIVSTMGANVDGDPRLRIAITGGSLGGLCAGLALHGASFDVQVYERTRGPMDTRGAGIVVQDELIELLRAHGAPPLPTTSCRIRRYLGPDGGTGQTQAMPQDFTSWEAIYSTLRAAYPADRYHMGESLAGVAPAPDGAPGVELELDGRGPVEADLLVCADGAQSANRARLLPEVSAAYAGYVAWRGTLDEAEAPPALVRFLDDAFTFSESRSGGHMLVYFIPGDGATTTVGRRRLNWVWYMRADETDLAGLLVDRDGRRHRASLPRGGAPDSTVRALVDRAQREVHPELAALVSATRPHTAGATAKAAYDATVLARALERSGRDIDAGLRRFESQQLDYGLALTRHGIALGDRWAAKAR